MTVRLLTGGLGGIALVLAMGCGATTVDLPEPGYLAIDGVYYGYGLREPATPGSQAHLNSLGLDGFHLATALDLGDCGRSDGLPLSVASIGQPRFRGADSATPPDVPGLAFADLGLQPVSVTLVACNQATVVLVNTADGNTSCARRIAFPLQRGVCPGLDAADSGHVFFHSFD